MEKVLNFFSKYNKFIIISGIILAALSFFDKKLFVSLILVFFLASLSLFFINRVKSQNQRKIISILFIIAFSLHIILVLFIFYGRFQPFSDGRGDYLEYNSVATKIADRLADRNFSLEGLNFGHYYAVIVGYLYYLTVSKMIVGQLLNAWLVALTVIFAYLTVKELGRSDKEAFITGMIVSIYPSLAFFGSLLLKEAFIVFFSTLALLLAVKLIKSFSWKIFILFYISLMGLTHFRFYISTVLVFVFIGCWLLFSDLKIKKRMIYGVIIVFLMGFLNMVNGFEQGYFGINAILGQLNIKNITYYRDVAYSFKEDSNAKVNVEIAQPVYKNDADNSGSGASNSVNSVNSNAVETPSVNDNAVETPSLSDSEIKQIIAKTPEGAPLPGLVADRDYGQDSSINIKSGVDSPIEFVKNGFISFIHAFFGPFPWQLRYSKHIFVLPEILLWWTCLFFIIRGVVKSIKSQYKTILPLLLFGVIVIGALSLYMTNFGLVTRLRMPAFVALFCLFPFGLKKLGAIKIPLLEKYFA